MRELTDQTVEKPKLRVKSVSKFVTSCENCYGTRFERIAVGRRCIKCGQVYYDRVEV